MPRTSLICIENTHNFESGCILPLEYMKELYEFARTNHLAVHLDGARIFNAAIASGISVKEYCSACDTVMFCLSKGLGCPVGSVLAGPGAFIAEARRVRKSYGGGMRQAGILAAAGIYALDTMVERLREDHDHAKALARGLASFPLIGIDLDRVQTNILFFQYKAENPSLTQFLVLLKKANILCLPARQGLVRVVTHCDISAPDIERTLATIADIFNQTQGR